MANGTIGLDADHIDLRDSVRALATRHITEESVRAAVEAKDEQLPAWWPTAADQGLLGLHLPESAGGAGYGHLELCVVLEELGRCLAPGPFLPTVLASAVLHAASHDLHLPGLADGTTVGAVALGGDLSAVVSAQGLIVSGTTAPVSGGQLADLFVLPVRVGDDLRWVIVRRGAMTIQHPPSHDLTRRLAVAELDEVPVAADAVLSLDPAHPYDLAAVLLGAEATGIADWSTDTATAYAGQRHQFGRPIGQFQAVKHRIARMLVRTEQARACVWDAARAADEDGTGEGEAALAAAVCGAVAVDAGFGVVKDLVNTLGGIGYTWEHLAGFALRRTQTSRILLGPSTDWFGKVAELSLAGVRRPLGLELPPEAEAIRTDIAGELDAAAALPGPQRTAHLARHGYTAPHLPAPWGKGADAVTQLVIGEELAARGLEPHDMIIGNWAVPTLIAHGSDDVQQRLVPGSLSGDIEWCQLFSEPGAGSDLAALSTRAEKVDGGWRVNGQKVWTSGAHTSDFGVLLARTDPEAAKHRGISYFVLDMNAPGIDIRPLRELTGGSHFNEVFLDDVFIPDDMLVGSPGEGWRLAITTLANERVHMTSNSATGTAELLFEHVDRTDDTHLARLGQLLAEAHSGGLLGLRQTIRSISGSQPGAESSFAKLISAENVQTTWETLVEWWGPAALVTDPEERDATYWFLNSRALTIAGGTTDVQLNIVGERILGLPRD